MDSVAVTGIVLGMLVVKALALFVIVYVGARLAIRHERRA
jgi:hypothetical protein